MQRKIRAFWTVRQEAQPQGPSAWTPISPIISGPSSFLRITKAQSTDHKGPVSTSYLTFLTSLVSLLAMGVHVAREKVYVLRGQAVEGRTELVRREITPIVCLFVFYSTPTGM